MIYVSTSYIQYFSTSNTWQEMVVEIVLEVLFFTKKKDLNSVVQRKAETHDMGVVINLLLKIINCTDLVSPIENKVTVLCLS